MRVRAAFVALLAVLVCPPAAAADPSSETLAAVNRFRAAHGEPALTMDARLRAAAQRHAEAMAADDFFSHTGANGSIIGERVTAAGYRWRLVAENLAAGMRKPEKVVGQWIESPGHRRNLLLDGLRHAGIGFAYRDPDPGRYNFRYYWVLVLAAPQE